MKISHLIIANIVVIVIITSYTEKATSCWGTALRLR